MEHISLPKIEGTGNPEVDAAIDEYRKAIINANNWHVNGDGVIFSGSATSGFRLKVVQTISGAQHAVAVGIIPAAPSTNKSGKGLCVLRTRGGPDGDDLSDGEQVEVFSNFTKAVPSGTRLEVCRAENGIGYDLVGADCPTV